MTADPVASQIRAFLREHFPSARSHALGEDDQLLANGVLDSLGVLDVVGFLEREFGITVADEDLMPENFETLSRLSRFVAGKRSGGA